VEKQCVWHDFFIWLSGEAQFMKLHIQTERRRRNFLVVLLLKIRHRFSSEISGAALLIFLRMYGPEQWVAQNPTLSDFALTITQTRCPLANWRRDAGASPDSHSPWPKPSHVPIANR